MQHTDSPSNAAHPWQTKVLPLADLPNRKGFFFMGVCEKGGRHLCEVIGGFDGKSYGVFSRELCPSADGPVRFNHLIGWINPTDEAVQS